MPKACRAIPRQASVVAAWVATLVATLVAAWPLTAIAAPAASTTTPTLAMSHDGFCTLVQRLLVDTRLPIENTLQTTKEAFTASKPAVAPTITQQFVRRDAAGHPAEISCKTKTADHLRAAHGPAAARDPALAPRSCQDIQRRVVRDVWATMRADERASAIFAPQRVMLDPDTQSYTGSRWISTPATAHVAADGRLHLGASKLFAAWEDWRWKIMPESFRGNHYCHLVAPERVRRLMTGAERLDP